VFEDFRIDWTWQLVASIGFLVVFASILAVNALHILMRHGEATRVTSMLYLPPIFAVAMEYLVFSVVPTNVSIVGIFVVSIGVAMAMSRLPAGAAIK